MKKGGEGVKKTKNPMPAAERQMLIRDFISDVRHTSIAEIAEQFSVSQSTVRRDLEVITPFTSFYTTVGNGGGLHAIDGWYASKRYLSKGQEELLRRLLPGLQPEDKALMNGILQAFSQPKNNEITLVKETLL